MKTKIIADLTSNHLGNFQVLEGMIECLAECNVNVVKTQSWRADKLRPDINNYNENYNYYTNHQLSDKDHIRIKELCDDAGLEMLVTCFDLERIDFLSTLGLESIKVASSDAASYRMIETLLDRFNQVIISTGATTDDELTKTMEICQGRNVVFLHCVAIYPCPLSHVNMDRMLDLRGKGFRVGYSDHTLGIEAGKYAISLGAECLEKHFTLNRYLPGRDQKMSATMEEMKELTDWAIKVEEMKGIACPALTKTDLKFRENYIGKWGDNT